MVYQEILAKGILTAYKSLEKAVAKMI